MSKLCKRKYFPAVDLRQCFLHLFSSENTAAMKAIKLFSIKKNESNGCIASAFSYYFTLRHSYGANVSCKSWSLLLMMRESVQRPSGWRFRNVQVQYQDVET